MIDPAGLATEDKQPNAGISRRALLDAGLAAGIFLAAPLASSSMAVAAPDSHAGRDMGTAAARDISLSLMPP